MNGGRVKPAAWAGIAALGVAAAAAVLWNRSTPPRAPSRSAASVAPSPTLPASAGECAFSVGDRAAFVVESNAQAEGAPPGATDHVESVLSWEVVAAPAPGTWLLRAALSGTELAQNLSRPEQRVRDPLDAAFMLRIGRDCRFTRKGFAPTWQPATRRFVSALVDTFEFVFAASGVAPRPSRWEVEQTDGMGRYAARYQGVGHDDGSLDVTRVKTSYLSDERAAAMGIRVQVVAAEALGTFDPAGRWLRKADGAERVRILAKDALLADLSQHYTLVRDDDAFVRPDPGALAEALDWQNAALMVAQSETKVDPGLASLSLELALERFEAIYTKAANGDAYAAALYLADWLKARPQAAAELLQALRGTSFPDAMRPAAFLGLERCGTPEARVALSQALADRSMAGMDRARAATALSDVPQPTRASALVLADMAAGSEPSVVSGTAVRALGHLAARQAVLEPGMADEVRKTLKQDLATAKGSSRTVDVLDAIGNSGDPSFLPDLDRDLTDPSSAIREHAARAMGSMPLDNTQDVLLQTLGTETDPDVRTALVQSLSEGHDCDAQALATGAQRLAAEPAPAVRAALIRWLGPCDKDQQVAKDALVAQFHRETVPALMQLIGQFVTAQDLQ
jgi:HEAT repeat protein